MVRMKHIIKNGTIEIVIWTNFGSEDEPFLPNGEEAMTDWGTS